MSGDRKGKAHVHSAAVMLNWRVQEPFDLSKRDDLVTFSADFHSLHAEDRAVEEDVFAAGEFGMKSGPHLQQASDPSTQSHSTPRRVGYAAQNFEQGAFASPILADDTKDLPTLHLEINVLQSPKFL